MLGSSFEKNFTSGHDSSPEMEEVGAEVMDTTLAVSAEKNSPEMLAQDFPDVYPVLKNMEAFINLNPGNQREVLGNIEKRGLADFIKSLGGPDEELE